MGSIPEADQIVRVRNLHKSYGDLHVLQGLSMNVREGSHVAIIGPSGSGKSTLLRLLMTLDRPDDGTIEIDGEHVWHEFRDGQPILASKAHVRRIRCKVGMVFQHFNLFPHMRVLKNITEAPRRVLGLSKEQANARAEELLELVGLSDKRDSWPGHLSGGQKQRVAIARALAMQPKIMLFDEVTSALDPELVSEVQAVLLDLAQRTSMTMIIVTHEMNFARDVAEYVYFFDHGHIVESGPSEYIFSTPDKARTKQFLETSL
jgi:polar amino acid transport system ATP-binding protein